MEYKIGENNKEVQSHLCEDIDSKTKIDKNYCTDIKMN